MGTYKIHSFEKECIIFHLRKILLIVHQPSELTSKWNILEQVA